MGKPALGVLYLLFFWTFIPALVALVECFLMPGRVEAYNAQVSLEVVTKIRAFRTEAVESHDQ